MEQLNETKTCDICAKDLPLNRFGKSNGYIRNQCKTCINARTYTQEKKRCDPEYARVRKLPGRIFNWIRYESKSTELEEEAGCTSTEGYEFVKEQFHEDMEWEDYGTNGEYSRGDWHLCHMKPLRNFDLLDPMERRKAFHYTNLIPLWTKDAHKHRDIYDMKWEDGHWHINLGDLGYVSRNAQYRLGLFDETHKCYPLD